MAKFENGKLIYNPLNSREDYQRLMLDILTPLKNHYSEGCARLYLGDTFAHYDIGATNMEAVSRPLWALVPFWAGGGDEEKLVGKKCKSESGKEKKLQPCNEYNHEFCNGDSRESVNEGNESSTYEGYQSSDRSVNPEPCFDEIYKKALVSGTDPRSLEYWGECTSFDQRFVEMAAISYGIMYAPDKVWNPLSDKEKDNLVNYLNKINEHPLPVCNWILFAVLVNIALRSVGRKYDETMLEKYLEGLETFYIGEGWYRDGDSNQKDYYISFAIHFYSLIYADRCKDIDPDRCRIYKERALDFAKQFIYWFDDRGEALAFGRSLTYRFSQVSFFSACLLAGIEPFPLPVMKGLIKRHLESWLDKRIFDRDGILSIGYGYANLVMGERYNAPGSPYWGMKTFAFLMLPEDHEFWSVEPADYPEEIINKSICPMPCADMLVYHHGNHITSFVPGVYSRFGHGHIVEKYSKFAYDTYTSFNVARSQYELDECAPNNMLAFFIDGYVYVRRQCTSSSIEADRVISNWSPYKGITVKTTIMPNENGYSSHHEIESEIDCTAYEFGFPVRRDDFESVDLKFETTDDGCFIENKYCSCKVSGGKGYYLNADPDTNLLYQRTALPGIEYQIKKGVSQISTRVDLRIK